MTTVEPITKATIPLHSPVASIVLHLFPGLAGVLAYVAAIQVAPHYNLPQPLVLVTVLSAVLIPIELGHLVIVARRVGAWRSPLVNAFGRPLRTWQYAVITLCLLAVTMAIYALVAPLDAWLAERYFAWLPGWFAPRDIDEYDHLGRGTLALYIILGILSNIAVPTAEELYYRGYLLPRIPGPTWIGPFANALLFAIAHFWQPQNYVAIFCAVLPLALAVPFFKSVRLGVYTHVALNLIGFAPTVIEVAARIVS